MDRVMFQVALDASLLMRVDLGCYHLFFEEEILFCGQLTLKDKVVTERRGVVIAACLLAG